MVDVDLSRFFDRVNHDILIDRPRKRVNDPGLIWLVRASLRHTNNCLASFVILTEDASPKRPTNQRKHPFVSKARSNTPHQRRMCNVVETVAVGMPVTRHPLDPYVRYSRMRLLS